jgi:hypothetical protein
MAKPLPTMIWQFLKKLNEHKPYDPIILPLECLSYRREKLCPHKNLYMPVCRSSSHNHPKLGTTTCPSIGNG